MRIRTMQVRPTKSVELSLPMGGLIQQAPTSKSSNLLSLGQKVQKAEISELDAFAISPGDLNVETDPLTSVKIFDHYSERILATIRANRAMADMDKAIAERRRQYFERYKHVNAISEALTRAYLTKPPIDAANRIECLNILERVAESRRKSLESKYKAVGGVHNYAEVLTQTSTSDRNGDKTYIGLDRFSVPRKDNEFRFFRDIADLELEILQASIESFKVSSIAEILQAELEAIDHQINSLRADFLDTLLLSPFDGVVAQVFKTIGESAAPFEPIIRVENWDSIFLLGWIQARAVLQLDQKLEITIKGVFEDPTKEKTLIGTIVSIRGHDSDNDEWEVVIECENLVDPLPVNYRFDRESTEIKTT